MKTLPALDAIISLKYYCSIAIKLFQEYTNKEFEGKLFQRPIRLQVNNEKNALVNKNLNQILTYYILHDIWIEERTNHFEI